MKPVCCLLHKATQMRVESRIFSFPYHPTASEMHTHLVFMTVRILKTNIWAQRGSKYIQGHTVCGWAGVQLSLNSVQFLEHNNTEELWL